MVRATPPLLYTEAPAGGGRVWLDRVVGYPSAVTGLKWVTTYPGGDSSLTANLNVTPDLAHAGLNLGRLVTVVSGGGARWRGILTQAQRGTPWQLQARGLASLVVSSAGYGAFMAVDSSGNAYNLNNIIDQAIVRGLPWTRPVSLGTAGSTASGSCDIDTALATVGQALGQCWSLSVTGAITMAAPPTTPLYVLRATQALNPQLAGFTQAIGTYQSSSTATATVTASNTTAIANWGHIEGAYDLRSLGVISSSTATTYLSNWLAANLAQPLYTDTILIQPGQLRAITPSGAMGGPVDLATVRAGCLIAMYDVDPSHSHLLTPGPLLMLVGQTEYDSDNDNLTLTPVGAVGTNLLEVLYQALGGAL